MLYSSCYCYGCRFWGALSLSMVLWKSAYSRSNMKPRSIPKEARKWIEELFCWFQVLRQNFLFPSFSFDLHASSFHFAVISFHSPFTFLLFVFISINFPLIFLSFDSNVHSCPFIFLSFACMLHVACSFHFAFRSFHVCLKLWKWLYGSLWLWLGQGTDSLRFSLNNASNIWHCSKEICHKNEREREREKESERVGCQMIW